MDDAHIERPARRGRFGTICGAVAALAVTAVGAAHMLATADLTGRGPQRVARTLQDPTLKDPTLKDPETTGSLADAARATRFDPCRAAARFPAAP